MAEAVAEAMSERRHLLVQAGTGTGKSLGYLVPALLNNDRVVVATATLALQHQLVERDIPALLEATSGLLDETGTYAVLKGRSNYACLHRVREGVPDDQGALVDLPEGSLGAEVVALREWVEEEAGEGGSGERDHAPRHTDRVWRQVSVSHRECLGATRCPYGVECFAERAKERGCPLAARRHQPLAARDRRDRGRADDPGVRRRGDRRGPRARRAGDPGGHRRALRPRDRPRRPPGAAARRGQRGRRPRRRRGGAARRHRRGAAGPGRPDAAGARRRPGARPRRGPRPGLGLPPRGPEAGGDRRRGQDPGQGLGPGDLRDRRADGRRLGQGRALGQRARPQPRRQPALRRAPRGRRADARAPARREDRDLHLGDPQARRRLRRGRDVARALAGQTGSPRWDRPTPSPDDGDVEARRLGGPRRRLAVRLRPAGDPLRRPPPSRLPAATG